MLMQIDDREERLLSKEEEDQFGKGLRRTLIHDRPNPDRVGCPDPAIIRDFAFHKRRGDTETFERLADHMVECSPCAQDALVFAEEYRYERKRRHVRLAAMGLAASVVLSVAVWQFARIQPKQEIAAGSSGVPAQPPARPEVADAGNHQVHHPPALRFEAVTIELPGRWRGAATPEPPIILPRGRLHLEIRLPIGSSEGSYKLRILDAADKGRITLEATAHIINGVTNLKATLDTSTLSPGLYALSVLEPGLDEWSDYHITVK